MTKRVTLVFFNEYQADRFVEQMHENYEFSVEGAKVTVVYYTKEDRTYLVNLHVWACRLGEPK